MARPLRRLAVACAIAWPALARAQSAAPPKATPAAPPVATPVPPPAAAPAPAPASPPAEEPPPKGEPAFLSVFINTVEQGDAYVLLVDDDALVDRSILDPAIHGFKGREYDVDKKRLVSLKSVRPMVRYEVDVENLALRIFVPLSMLPTHDIDLAEPPPRISRHHRASVFINYSPSVVLTTTGNTSASGFFETGISEQNHLWYSSFFASTTNGASRGLTSLTIDDRPKLMKLTLGESTITAGPIGGAATLAGVTLARDWLMDPYFIRFPTMRFVSATEVPARLDIYVNGVRIKSQQIDPGTFTLDNIRGLQGAGNIRYVIRDVLGREQAWAAPYYVGPQVLKKGLTDFGVGAGFPRNDVGTGSFGYDAPALIAYYQRGLTSWFTAGGRAEARFDRVSGGPTLATTTTAGLFGLEAAGSTTLDGHAGAAGVASYQYLNRWFSAGASLRALTKDYVTSTLDYAQDRSLYQATGNVSVPLGQRATFLSELTLDVHRDVPDSERLASFVSTSLSRDVSLMVQAALDVFGGRTASLDGFVTLTWVPHQQFGMAVGASKTGDATGATLQLNKSAKLGEDWGGTLAADSSNGGALSISERLQAHSNVVTTLFDWTPHGTTLDVNPAGGIVWVSEGGWFLTRPVIDAFALVRIPDVKDVRVQLNSQEVGRTNAEGNLLVPSLSSYYGVELKVDPGDVPFDYSLDDDVVMAVPPRRGAAFAEFPAHRIRYFRGRMRVVRDGVEGIPLYGDLAVKNRGDWMLSPIGEDGTFELEGLLPGPHDAEVRHTSGLCRFHLDVKDEKAVLVDLGMLRCYAR